MDNREQESIRRLVSQLMEHIPDEGGHMICHRFLHKHEQGFYGDRLAFMRLGLALLRYACEAEIVEGTLQAELRFLDRFFSPPSKLQDVGLQLDQAPPRLEEDQRTDGLFAWLSDLFGRRGRK